jgi:cytochrome c biogenesis protein CcdA
MNYTEVLNNSSFPILTAFLLGIITAIHPCPLTLNITAISYISNDIKKKGDVFKKGLVYTLGRMITYTALALVIYLGFDAVKLSNLAHHYGEKMVGPFLILFGIIMLDLMKFELPLVDKISSWIVKKNRNKSSFMLGVIFALAFCPHSILFFFGMLIPLVITSSYGMILPCSYAIGTGIPVIIVSWILAFSISNISNFYEKIKIIEIWMRRVTAIIFIFAGTYFIIENFFL